jgi:thymidylate synthase (FAD)
LKTDFDISNFFQKETVLDKGSIELIDGMVADPLLKIVNSARVSFLKESKELSAGDKKLIKFLFDHEHFSTFRHSYFSFRIKAPLCVFRQWWKYQIGCDWVENENVGVIEIPQTNWNEASYRYIEFKPEFYIPSEIRKQSKDNKQGSYGKIENMSGNDPVYLFELACKDAYLAYKEFVDFGAAKEQARMLLPQNIYSECIWTCSLQTVLYFLHQRLKEDAQWEIREYAKATWNLMKPMIGMLREESTT